MSASGKRWRLRGRFPDGELADAPYPALLRHLLWHRGIRSVDDAASFLEPSLSPEHDPLLLPDIGRALARLRQAIKEGETIAVFGDFDVDGLTAAAVLTEALHGLGAKVIPHIPDRFGEGYGLNMAAIEGLRQLGADLMIAADCGTSSVKEIEYAARLGMHTIVLDHHIVPGILPEALAVVNPKRSDSLYPERELTSAGLAYKLIAALFEASGRVWAPERYLDLVALGTVADVAPLRGENRLLVKRGLAALAGTQRPGLCALMQTAGLDPASLDVDSIGYLLAPRLNAAGRIAHARLAFDLLLERDEAKAGESAIELSALNQERQRRTAAAMELARELLAVEDAAAPLIFIGHEKISSGIVGLIAGRLTEERYRPAVVYERSDKKSRASCRSIPEFHITEALRSCRDLMVRFGGHAAAAGFTVANEKLAALKENLTRVAEKALSGLDLTPALDIDAAVPLQRINGKHIQYLMGMAPFGEGNPRPLFLSRALEVADVRPMGNSGKHLRLRLRDGRVTWPAAAFDLGPSNGAGLEVRPGQRLDVVYSFCRDRGGEGLELRVEDFRDSKAEGEISPSPQYPPLDE